MFALSLNVKVQFKCLFQTIQSIISTPFSSIWPIDIALSDATIPGQSGPGSNGNEGVLHIPKAPILKPHHQIV